MFWGIKGSTGFQATSHLVFPLEGSREDEVSSEVSDGLLDERTNLDLQAEEMVHPYQKSATKRGLYMGRMWNNNMCMRQGKVRHSVQWSKQCSSSRGRFNNKPLYTWSLLVGCPLLPLVSWEYLGKIPVIWHFNKTAPTNT